MKNLTNTDLLEIQGGNLGYEIGHALGEGVIWIGNFARGFFLGECN